MGSGGSRTYIVRVWLAAGSRAHGGRAVIEEVHSGRQAELRGEAAADLAERLDGVVSSVPSDPSKAGASGSRSVPQEGAVR